MPENKTQVTEVDPQDFVDAVEHPTRRADAQVLLELMGAGHRLSGQDVGPHA